MILKLIRVYLFCLSLLHFNLSFSQTWEGKSGTILLGIGDNYVHKNYVYNNINLYTSKSTGSKGKINLNNSPSLFLKYESRYNSKISFTMVFGYRQTEIIQTIPYTYYVLATSQSNPNLGVFYVPLKANDIFTFKTQDINIGARFNYHLIFNKKIDPYIGLACGYRMLIKSYSYTTDNPRGVYYVVDYEKDRLPIYLGATIGIKYLLTNEFGVFAEVGIDKMSIIHGGVALKIQ